MHDPRFGPLTHTILGACIEVHEQLGPGLLESAYEECLALEMRRRALRFECQPRIPPAYKGHRVEHAFQPDFIVSGKCLSTGEMMDSAGMIGPEIGSRRDEAMQRIVEERRGPRSGSRAPINRSGSLW